MTRRFTLALLTVLLTVPVTSCGTGVRTLPLNRLTYATTGVFPVQPLEHDGSIVCAAFSIGSGSWVSANHCWTDEHRLTIAGHSAAVLAFDETLDVMVLSSDLKTDPLPRGTAVSVDDPVMAIGFPARIVQPTPLHGRVAVLQPQTQGRPPNSDLFLVGGMCAGFGMSGGPVLKNGRVVGVMLSGMVKPCLDGVVSINAIWSVVGVHWQTDRIANSIIR